MKLTVARYKSVTVADHTADPGLTLVSGITSTDAYLKHFAYAELRGFATEDSPAASNRRTALFGDQKYNPSMWSTLARESLLTLGHDYQLFLRRGQPAPSGTHLLALQCSRQLIVSVQRLPPHLLRRPSCHRQCPPVRRR